MSRLSHCTRVSCSLAILVLTAIPAVSATVGNVAMADSIQVGLSRLHLYSATIKEATFLNVDVYAVAIYLEDPTTPPDQVLTSDQVKAVELTFVIDVKKSKLASAWVRDLKNSCPSSCDRLLASAGTLARKLPDIRKGDRVSYHLQPARVDVFVNDEVLGLLEDEMGPVSVLSAFVGPRAPDALRRVLLKEATR